MGSDVEGPVRQGPFGAVRGPTEPPPQARKTYLGLRHTCHC